MRARALFMAAVLTAYLLVVGWRGVLLIRDGRAVPVLLGVALLVLPLLGAWAMVREVSFGRATEQLAGELEATQGLPPDDMPRAANGRPDPERAPEWFAAFRAAAEAAPQDWPTWFRLACAYDAMGDRKQARAAMRHAVSLYRG